MYNNSICDVSLAKTCGLYQRIMGVPEELGVSEEHGRDAL
jgi:hypothetical protein